MNVYICIQYTVKDLYSFSPICSCLPTDGPVVTETKQKTQEKTVHRAIVWIKVDILYQINIYIKM